MSIGICRLDELAEVQLGVKTFLNPFFYVDSGRISDFGIEQQFLEPVFRTGDAARDRFQQRSASTKLRIFNCSTTVNQLVGTGAAAYIKWAAKQHHTSKGTPGGFWKETPAVKPKTRVWYQNQAMPPPARIVLLKAFDDSFAPMILDKAIRVDQRFNQVRARPGVDEDVLIGLLCSIWFVMLCETFGATSLGQGALEVRTETLRGLQVPDIRQLTAAQLRDWKAATKKLVAGARRPVKSAVVNADQQRLDKGVLRALGLNVNRLDELYEETLRMGSIRRQLAAGRGTMRREQFATDVHDVAQDIAAQLRPLLQRRRFPQDFLTGDVATTPLQFGNTPLHVHGELMMGQRHVLVTSGASVVYDQMLPEPVGDLLIRALELGSRSIPLPTDDGAAAAALTTFEMLVKQLDNKINRSLADAGSTAQATLRDDVEKELNLPIKKLVQPLGSVYDLDLS